MGQPAHLNKLYLGFCLDLCPLSFIIILGSCLSSITTIIKSLLCKRFGHSFPLFDKANKFAWVIPGF